MRPYSSPRPSFRLSFLPALFALLIVAASLSAQSSPSASAPPATLPDPAFADDTRAWLRGIEKVGFSGVVLVATEHGPIVAEGLGLADREKGVRWATSTLSDVGSITKQFTAALILKLEELGKLAVTDAIGRHLEGVPADKQGVTLHHLLTHSSGIEDLEGAGDWDPIRRDDFVRRALAQPLSAPPGSQYSYSNAGYSLLGAIAEKVTGKSYEEALRELVLVPAGLTETGYVVPKWDPARLAQGYRAGERWGTTLERPMDTDGPFWVLRANGGLRSTAEEMLRWARALLDGKVLSAASRQKLWTPHVDESNGEGESFYGYGWSVVDQEGVRILTHNGGNGIHFADFAIVPERGVVVFLQTNVVADYPGARDLLSQIGRRFLAAEAYPKVPPVIDVPAATLASLAGTYSGESQARFEVSSDGKTLRVLPTNRTAFDRLYSPTGDAGLIAKRAADTERMLAAGLAGDFQPLHTAYGGTVPIERLRDSFAGRMRDQVERLGPFVRIEVVGTAAAEEGRHRVPVRFVHEKGEVLISYAWAGGEAGKLLGVDRRPFDPALRLFPLGQGRFASWDSVTAASLTARFVPRPEGAMALELGSEGKVAGVRR